MLLERSERSCSQTVRRHRDGGSLSRPASNLTVHILKMEEFLGWI
jgi:hypothetical protein